MQTIKSEKFSCLAHFLCSSKILFLSSCIHRHQLAQFQRLLRGPHYWHSTSFILQDIWKADLRKVNVIAVYGLGPIMKDLGIKLEDELEPGSLVMSNVFRFPGWIPVSTSDQNTFLYVIPQKKRNEGTK